ncbi:hypothetical protein PV327_000683 [Microctonus hyperodae]|uniref:Protein rolling stone n=2 Tax=Microctonus hyperodae TaxID=165561 RepID=A0AA39G7M9_MICHY|nr:hypothetical protein PV327_000683 [Microctonus hyperodae]
MWGYDHRPAAFIECPFTTQHHQHLMSPGNRAQVTSPEFSSVQLCITPEGAKTKDSLYLKSSSYCGRRGMVNNIFCRKISRAWLQTKSNPPHPRVFTEPRIQNITTLGYLIYRWMISLLWISIIVCSLFDYGSSKPPKTTYTWPIYLTNWDLVIGAIQSILGVILVTKRWTLQKTQTDSNACNIIKYGKLEKLYYVLYTIACTLAVGVTVSYWAAVYDSKIHTIDPLNIMLHVCNSLLILMDVLIVSIPLKFRHFWWCLVLILFYLTFSIIYYAAGGLDKNGYHHIYKILDWKKPGITILIALGGMLFLVMVHCLLCYLTILLSRICKSDMKYMEEPPSASNEQTQKSKDVEIV